MTMSLPYELPQKLEVLRQEFAEVSQHRFSEIIDILSDCPERPAEEVSVGKQFPEDPMVKL